MRIFSTKSKIIVTCKTRLSDYLAQEIEALGYEIKSKFITGVELFGTMDDCIRLNLHLHTASQVLFSLKAFYCNSPEDLYKNALKIKWHEILEPDTYFSITSNVTHSSINNDLFANVKLKDAIVDAMRNVHGKRPESGPDKSNAVFNLFWKDHDAEIFVDTSGETLAKHGYRKMPGKAPMLESLASACIIASGWDKKSHFINPMCGAGTLAIEAALIATQRKPGLYRSNYCFMHLKNYCDDIYENELNAIKENIISTLGFQIIATDISKDAIKTTMTNAEAAGVIDLIDFDVCDFAKTEIPQHETGIVIMNPEYGERLGKLEELEITYKRIGDFMKQQCQGYKGLIFTGNLDLAKKIGLKASRRYEFFNGKIDCRLLSYELYGGTRRKEANETPTN